MSESLVNFDADELKKRVVSTIQGQFGKLIPEDKWIEMVERETKAFFEEECWLGWEELKEKGQYDHFKVGESLKYRISPFRQMVWSELHKLVKVKLNGLLENGKFEAIAFDNYDGNIIEGQLSGFLENKLEELAPKMVTAMFKGMFAQTSDLIKQDIIKDFNSNNSY